ncbi:hypothetical protein FRB93_009404 [Tulasnella sp. JGI-2019a]|nr:hypothetical protein FRB93_009404 [Tulasnella sp. JGI-2019a]
MAATSSSSNRQLRKSSPNTINGKFLVGYCGWYTCPGDGGCALYPGHHGWHKWFEKPLIEKGHPRFDLYPDMTIYDDDESYAVPGLTLPDSTDTPAKLFSSRNPTTVKRHFHLMAQHGIDGIFLMRLANECEVDGNSSSPLASLMRISDETLDFVREAAEAEGRVWALMYDITGVAARKLNHVLKVDWAHMVLHKRILDSPNYLRENGRPVIAIRGVGIKGTSQDLSGWFAIISQLRSFTPGGAYIILSGSPHWRTPGQGDQENNPGFTQLYREVDAICPWSPELVTSEEMADGYADIVREDMKLVKQWNQESGPQKRLDYIPVAFPGLSCQNLSGRTYNEVPRQSGKLLWRQIYHYQRAGAHTIFGAMFDDFNQGTALMPAVPLTRSLPNERKFLALDADGDTSLSPDWYLRICGVAAEAMRGEKRIATDLLPRKELDDYWAFRPKYEEGDDENGASSSRGPNEASGSSSAASTDSGATSYAPGPPMRSETIDDLPPPPPPYSLEDEEAEGSGVPGEGETLTGTALASTATARGYNSAGAPESSAPRPASTTPTNPNSALPQISELSLSEPASSYQAPLSTSPTLVAQSIPPVSTDENDSSRQPMVPSGRPTAAPALSNQPPSGPAPSSQAQFEMYQRDPSTHSVPNMTTPGQAQPLQGPSGTGPSSQPEFGTYQRDPPSTSFPSMTIQGQQVASGQAPLRQGSLEPPLPNQNRFDTYQRDPPLTSFPNMSIPGQAPPRQGSSGPSPSSQTRFDTYQRDPPSTSFPNTTIQGQAPSRQGSLDPPLPSSQSQFDPYHRDPSSVSFPNMTIPGQAPSGQGQFGGYQRDQSPASFPSMTIPGRSPDPSSPSGSSQLYQRPDSRVEPNFGIAQHDPRPNFNDPDVGGFASPDLIRRYSSRQGGPGPGVPPPPMHPTRLSSRPSSPPTTPPAVGGIYNPPPRQPLQTRPYNSSGQSSYQGQPQSQSPSRQDYAYPSGPTSSSIGRPQSQVPGGPFDTSSYGGPTPQGPGNNDQVGVWPSFPTMWPYENQQNAPPCQSQSYYTPPASSYSTPGSYPSVPGGYPQQQSFPQSSSPYPPWNAPPSTPSSPPLPAPPSHPGNTSPAWPGTSTPPQNTNPYGPYPSAPRPPRPQSSGSGSSGTMPIPRPAIQALDRFGVNEERRRQLEQGMGNVLQTGTKWLNHLRK